MPIMVSVRTYLENMNFLTKPGHVTPINRLRKMNPDMFQHTWGFSGIAGKLVHFIK